ncbi:MAG: glycoside hydrolase, partial [Thermoplasmata archaeon]|nr:glycoside hydrolase [Thermoplasmata archaeon]
MIRENPSDPRNLVSGARTYAAAAANDTTTYYDHGLMGAFTSWDGGRTWTGQYLPTNPAWTDPNSALCGRNHGADTAIGFGPGDVVYYVDLVADSGTSVLCSRPGSGVAIYATISHDGGDTWNTPVAIGGTTDGAHLDKPWIAVDQSTGEAFVAYSDFTDYVNGTHIWIQNSTDEGASWSNPVELTA